MRHLHWIPLVILFSLGNLASAAEPPNCGKIGGDLSIRYCQWINPASNRLLIYFHGVGQDERRLFRADLPYPPFSRIPQGSLPSVMAVSMGSVGILTDENRIKRIGDFLKKQKLKMKSDQPIMQKTVLMGDSMGGFNALQVFLRSPDLFEKMILICPALTLTSPFAPIQEWNSDPDAKHGWSILRYGFRQLLRQAFGAEQIWNRSSPFAFLQATEIKNSSAEVFIGIAQNDRYGFIHSNYVLAENLNRIGVEALVMETSGAFHCNVNPQSVSDFILNE